MATTTQESAEYAKSPLSNNTDMLRQHELGGKTSIAYFTTVQSGAGDAGSSVLVAQLPPGRVRLIGAMCNAYVNWTTATAKLDVGFDAYTDIDGDAVAASVNGIDDGVDVETAASVSFGSALTATGGTMLFESKAGVGIRLTSTDTAIKNNDSAVGYLVYVAEK